MELSYDTVQLNQFDWYDFLNRLNPIASALMAKMRIAPKDRPRVKLECLRMLVGLDLNWAKTQLISGFVDKYLPLNTAEKVIFDDELAQIVPAPQKEEVMKIVTSWM